MFDPLFRIFSPRSDRAYLAHLTQEYLRAERTLVVVLAGLTMLLMIGMDFLEVGFRIDFFLIRIGYFPYILGGLFVCDRVKKLRTNFPYFSAFLALTYIGACSGYFASVKGGLAGDYLQHLVDCTAVLSFLPFSYLLFVETIGWLASIYVLTLIALGAFRVSDIREFVSIYVVDIFYFHILHFGFSTLRRDNYLTHRELEKVLADREARIQRQSQELSITRAEAEVGQLAAQVAHDIRSPTAALEMIASSMDQLPEDLRLIMRTATRRIRDISNQLLDRRRKSIAKHSRIEGRMEVVHLLHALDEIISEKQFQFRQDSKIEINFEVSPETHHLFAKADPVEFRTVLSNLINNSVEAPRDHESIQVKLKLISEGTNVVLSVLDNGKGIPPDVLSKISTTGFSFGKSDGSGLGIAHAKKNVEEWSGSLLIQSEVGSGTEVKVVLPKAEPPSWSVARVILPRTVRIVIVDDDPHIHAVWERRLQSFVRESSIQISHFHDSENFEAWWRSQKPNGGNFYFFDYEIIGSPKNGLDLITSYQLQRESILVTNSFENLSDHCVRLGVKLLPKVVVNYVEIALEN